MSDSSQNKKSWYALYVRSRAEKQVASYLHNTGFEVYLPLTKILRQWSDRKKWVEEPLFRSYIFVHIGPAEYFDVLNTQGVVRYVSFESKAVAIPPLQIEAIRQFVESGEELPDVELTLKPGSLIDIIIGPMKGIRGELLEMMGKKKVKIEIEGLGQSVFLEVPASHIKPVNG